MAKLRCKVAGCRRRTYVKIIPADDRAETVRVAVERAATMEGWGGSWRAWLCPPCDAASSPAPEPEIDH
jgi:hypothetical protein